jgi:hypothetical protein
VDGSATIITLPTRRRERLHAEQAAKLRQLLLPFEEELGDTITEILYYIDRRTAASNKWTFVMLSPGQNEAIVNYLIDNSKRPMQAVKIWALCFSHLNNDTGEIMLRRDEIADRLDMRPNEVSQIMGELATRNAIITRRTQVRGMRGKGVVRYYMNPTVATHLSGKARDLAQDAAPQPITTTEPKIMQFPTPLPAR